MHKAGNYSKKIRFRAQGRLIYRFTANLHILEIRLPATERRHGSIVRAAGG
jgi:hypothetical protein